MKKETLEGAVKSELEFIHNSCRNFDFDLGFKTGGLIGAKWQQEQDKNKYSEEEVKFIISEALQSALVNVDLEQWFEKFKKKIR